MKHIYWFAYYNLDAPSSRYRAKYALEHLSDLHGITYSFVYPEHSLWGLCHFAFIYISALCFRKKGSLLVFQRIYSTGFFSRALKILLYFQPKDSLYDIDDAEYLLHPPDTMNHFITHCETCSVGSKTLMKYAFQFNSSVQLLTSPILPHTIRKCKRNETITVGWIGYYDALTGDGAFSHKNSLEQLFFSAIDTLDFPIRLVILGVRLEKSKRDILQRFAHNRNIVLDIPLQIEWRDETAIYQRINEFDIGLSPLLNHEMNRAKSAFKLKQYLSCGVPVLASPVGENKRFIKHGVNGYFCEYPNDFKANILTIRQMKDEEYAQVSHQALISTSTFSMNRYCSQLLGIFNQSPEGKTSFT